MPTPPDAHLAKQHAAVLAAWTGNKPAWLRAPEYADGAWTLSDEQRGEVDAKARKMLGAVDPGALLPLRDKEAAAFRFFRIPIPKGTGESGMGGATLDKPGREGGPPPTPGPSRRGGPKKG